MNDTLEKMVLCLSSDLMMTGKISSLTRELNIPCRVLASLDQLKKWLDDRPDCARQLWLIDLQRCQGQLESIKEHATALEPAPKVIAYAQHVLPELIESGKLLGFDQVLTRGRFDKEVGPIINAFDAE